MKISPAIYERMLPSAVAIVAGLGVLMLGMGQRDLRLSAVAMLAVAASYVLTDLTGWLRLNRMIANIAAVAAVGVSINDFLRFERDTQLLAVANLLVYLQIVLLFQEKAPRVYWQILVLSLLQVVISAALNLGALFGVLLVVYMLVMFVALMLLFARRESLERSAGFVYLSAAGSRPVAGATHLASPYDSNRQPPGAAVVTIRLGSIAREIAWASLTTLLVTAVVFFSVPRFGNTMWEPTSLSYQPTVGFSGTVTLGTLGAVADNPEIVMQVEFRSEDDPTEPYLVHNEPLFRGTVLTQYRGGEWRTPFARNASLLAIGDKPPAADGVIQRINIEPLDEPVVFGVYPLYKGNSPRAKNYIVYDPFRQQFQRIAVVQNRRFYFDTVTTGFSGGLQRPITPAFRIEEDERERLLQLPSLGPMYRADTPDGDRRDVGALPTSDVLPETTATARRQIERAGLARGEQGFTFNAARTLELYLRSSRFRYSLQPQARDPALDPVEDFIANNPQGHCEYFASALALMLRSQGIPSRVVVGFKGGDYNQVGAFYQVRQLHAHAWVEAYLEPDEIPPDMQPPEGSAAGGWLTLDPTPAAEDAWDYDRGDLMNMIADLGDYLRHLWSNYVVGLNAERQRDAIYRPLAQIATNMEQLVEGRQGVAALVWQWLRTNALTFRGLFILVAVTAAAIYVGRRVIRLIWALYRRWNSTRAGGAKPARVEFYERLERILARQGLVRGAGQTPLEFALAAGAQMVADSAMRPHATLPRRIVEAYYRVRFGRQTLAAHEAEAVEQQLVRLADVLRDQKCEQPVPQRRT